MNIINVAQVVDENLKKKLWSLYRKAFEYALVNSPVRQAMNKKEFLEALSDTGYTKFILRGDANEVLGIGLVTQCPEKIYWVNPIYFQKKYPRYFKKKRICFVDGIAISVEAQSLGYGKLLVREMLRWMDSFQGIGVFDCASNVDAALQKSLSQKGALLDTQSFYAVTSQKRRS